jgi:hypothetical protein
VTAWTYRFLIIGLAFFNIAPASRHANDDQPGLLNVHIRDYCDPVSFAARLRAHRYSCFGGSDHPLRFSGGTRCR